METIVKATRRLTRQSLLSSPRVPVPAAIERAMKFLAGATARPVKRLLRIKL